MRVIYISAIGKSVSLGAYVNAVKKAKAYPNAEFRHGLTTWWPCSGKDIVQQFMSGVHDRINAKIPAMKRGK